MKVYSRWTLHGASSSWSTSPRTRQPGSTAGERTPGGPRRRAGERVWTQAAGPGGVRGSGNHWTSRWSWTATKARGRKDATAAVRRLPTVNNEGHQPRRRRKRRWWRDGHDGGRAPRTACDSGERPCWCWTQGGINSRPEALSTQPRSADCLHRAICRVVRLARAHRTPGT